MRIFIGHNGHSALSRQFVERYQNQPEVEDVLDYLHEVGPFTNYQGFPFVGVIMDDGTQHTLYNPASWEVVTAWIAGLAEVLAVKQTRFTPAEFMRLLTKDELDAVLEAEATDIDVKRMWAFIRAVGYVDMTDPLTEMSLHVLRGKSYLATDERLQQVKDGVFQL